MKEYPKRFGRKKRQWLRRADAKRKLLPPPVPPSPPVPTWECENCSFDRNKVGEPICRRCLVDSEKKGKKKGGWECSECGELNGSKRGRCWACEMEEGGDSDYDDDGDEDF